ncbi:MAG: D-2-hydroxyacid dehydrogenase [Myxococcales bacterium]|nr:D-2-hydroxyacid dehydrogenase [Myxococcales bacterium]
MPNRNIDTILLAYELLAEVHLQRIAAAAPSARLLRPSELAAEPEPERIDVLMGYLPPGQLERLTGLRWMQQPGAGADWLMRAPAFRDSDVLLSNASGVHAIPIAEHVLALMFALSRRLHFFVKAQTQRKWDRRGRLGELEGSTLGIVGVGAIGEALANKARGLGMRVLGLRRDKSRVSPHVEKMLGPGELHHLLGESDWVAVTAALTPETRGLFGAAEFAAMKESAYLINIGRGAILDEQALITALESKTIAGAGLDVFEREPLPEDSPLWAMKNVILTPHFAGATPHYADRVTEIFVDNLERYQRGEPLRNLVDKQRAY